MLILNENRVKTIDFYRQFIYNISIQIKYRGWVLILSIGGFCMKRLISSTVSFVTALTMTMCAGTAGAVFAVDDTSDVVGVEMTLGDADFGALTLPSSPKAESNYSSGTFNYGDQLDANNLAVYNRFVKLTEPDLTPFTIKLPETVTLKVSALPGSSDFTDEDQLQYQLAIFGACKPGIDAALFDCPEIYWIEPSGINIAIGNDTGVTSNFWTGTYTLKIRSLTITPAYLEGFSSLEEAKEYGTLLKEGLDKVSIEGSNRYEQLKSIHDYISKFTYYDLQARFDNSALGAVVEPGVVCEGYAEAFKIMCDRLDIPCVCVFGNFIPEENSGHMWNYVKMEDDIWYAMDVTWDDVDGKNGREVKYDYFLKGSKSFFVKHTPESDYNITHFTYPEISENDYVLTTVPKQTTTTTTTSTVTTTTTSASTTKKTTSTTTSTTSKPHTTLTSISTTVGTSVTSATTSTKSKTTTAKLTTTTTTTKKPVTTTTIVTTTVTKPKTTSTTTLTTTQPPKPLLGDLNRDGSVNVADLVYCQATVLGKIKPEYSCDANSDGHTDSFDIVFMRKLIIKAL